MPDGARSLSCDCCASAGELHYRVRTDALTEWIFVCPSCWPELKAQPGYRYGGTRKADRRRRRR
ncbi:MAG: hypothetical protein ED554_04630 [Synechococcus sp. YX04-3]|nr:MAG: hypothetical protein ED554_04630 [Synechococcus sp. YX04-3]